MTRRICVVTGTRAEYGLLRGLMRAIDQCPSFELQVVATASHLSPAHGLTVQEIESDGFDIDVRIESLLSSDTPEGITKSMGLGMIGFADAFKKLAPDAVVLLGDRYEILAAATAALIARVPIVHIHGGETTEGAFDESIRHALTKMASVHFVAAEEYSRRVIQLGEQPDTVFNVGSLGVDAASEIELIPQHELETFLGVPFGNKSLLITFHPVTLASVSSTDLMASFLDALGQFPDVTMIFTMPNADTEGQALHSMLQEFVSSRDNCVLFPSLGQRRYLSCMQFVDGVVGNSSSGIIEAPAMRVGTVNVGARQKGRLSSQSVIHSADDTDSIVKAIKTLLSDRFCAVVQEAENPYGHGGAAERMLNRLRQLDFGRTGGKSFFDVDFRLAGDTDA